MRWAALAVMAMVLLLEGRFRWEDWQARQEFRFVPVALRPGTMEVWAPQGPELVAVNGRPVVGTSGYWRELRRYEELAEKSGPFVLSLRRADGTVVERQPIFGNCTCGKMTDLKSLWYAMLPPVVMILVGVARGAAVGFAGVGCGADGTGPRWHFDLSGWGRDRRLGTPGLRPAGVPVGLMRRGGMRGADAPCRCPLLAGVGGFADGGGLAVAGALGYRVDAGGDADFCTLPDGLAAVGWNGVGC